MAGVFNRCNIGFSCLVAFLVLTGASAQDSAPHEIGVVYYADGASFKPLEKEAAPASGHIHFSAKMQGAHAAIRLPAGQAEKFRVCSIDPTRYNLYKLRSAKKALRRNVNG